MRRLLISTVITCALLGHEGTYGAVTGDLLRTSEHTEPLPYGGFGRSVATVGGNVLIGAPRIETGGAAPGSAYPPGEGSQYFWSESEYRHYLLVDITPETLHGEWWGIIDFAKMVEEPRPAEELRRVFKTTTGAQHLVQTDAPTTPSTTAPPLAP